MTVAVKRFTERLRVLANNVNRLLQDAVLQHFEFAIHTPACHTEPYRKHGSMGLRRLIDGTAEAGNAGVEPLQSVDGREVG